MPARFAPVKTGPPRRTHVTSAALVDASGAVVQFLSYEGTFTAVGGPADGLDSTDIGVEQGGSTPVGSSLYLTGTGLAYGELTWTAGEDTFEQPNTGQTFGEGKGEPPVDEPPVLGDDSTVFINELHYDNVGVDEGEAIEVAGPAGTDLTGWQLVLYNGANGAVYQPTRTLAGTIPEQQNGYGTVFEGYASNGIQNGSPDGVALVDAVGLDLVDDDDETEADLAVEVEGSSPNGHGGPPVTFTVTVTNNSGVDVDDLTVEHDADLPDGVELQQAMAPPGTSFDEDELTWSIPTLEAGEELELTLRFRIRPFSDGDVTLAAEVEAEDNDDPNDDNDSDEDTVNIRPVPGHALQPR